jgi:hypothetical protein
MNTTTIILLIIAGIAVYWLVARFVCRMLALNDNPHPPVTRTAKPWCVHIDDSAEDHPRDMLCKNGREAEKMLKKYLIAFAEEGVKAKDEELRVTVDEQTHAVTAVDWEGFDGAGRIVSLHIAPYHMTEE